MFSLNPATRRREVVASLPFGPRCIGARYGWVCVGGVENGQFATIRVGEPEKEWYRRRPRGSGDEAMGPGIEPEHEGAETGLGGSRRPEVNISHLGGSIVNSVTLHRPPSSTSDDDVVAVLTYPNPTITLLFCPCSD